MSCRDICLDSKDPYVKDSKRHVHMYWYNHVARDMRWSYFRFTPGVTFGDAMTQHRAREHNRIFGCCAPSPASTRTAATTLTMQTSLTDDIQSVRSNVSSVIHRPSAMMLALSRQRVNRPVVTAVNT